MAEQWYVNRYTPGGPQQSGPMAFEDVKQMAAQGQLAPTDAVFRQGAENWVPASSVPALYAAIPPAGPMAPPSPYGAPPPYYPPPARSSAVPTILIILGVCGVGGVLLIIVCLAAITTIGTSSSATFSTVGSKLAGPPPVGVKYTQEDFRQRVTGKTMTEVRQAMGEPVRKENLGRFNETWVYTDKLDDGELNTTAKVRFTNGRVTLVTFE